MMFVYIFIVLFVTPGCHGEPVCSKFAYEEKLLEKMIRTEFNVEQMDKSMKETSNIVGKTLAQLQDHWDEMSGKFQEMKKESKVKYDNNEAVIKREMEEMKKERKKTLAEYDSRITKCEGAVWMPNVAFRARSPSLLDPVEDQVIVFTNDIFNIGNAYDNTSGVFTAPIGGTYFFTSQLCLLKRKATAFGIFVNDDMYTAGKFYEYRHANCFSIETSAVVEAGMQASVKSWSSSAGNVLKDGDNEYWSMFSGTLIHK